LPSDLVLQVVVWVVAFLVLVAALVVIEALRP